MNKGQKIVTICYCIAVLAAFIYVPTTYQAKYRFILGVHSGEIDVAKLLLQLLAISIISVSLVIMLKSKHS